MLLFCSYTSNKKEGLCSYHLKPLDIVVLQLQLQQGKGLVLSMSVIADLAVPVLRCSAPVPVESGAA
jgi:hypothetical protein